MPNESVSLWQTPDTHWAPLAVKIKKRFEQLFSEEGFVSLRSRKWLKQTPRIMQATPRF